MMTPLSPCPAHGPDRAGNDLTPVDRRLEPALVQGKEIEGSTGA